MQIVCNFNVNESDSSIQQPRNITEINANDRLQMLIFVGIISKHHFSLSISSPHSLCSGRKKQSDILEMTASDVRSFCFPCI